MSLVIKREDLISTSLKWKLLFNISKKSITREISMTDLAKILEIARGNSNFINVVKFMRENKVLQNERIIGGTKLFTIDNDLLFSLIMETKFMHEIDDFLEDKGEWIGRYKI